MAAHAPTFVSATEAIWTSAALGGIAVLVYGIGHLGYDAGWSLLWGKQIAGGKMPTFEAAGAPTPHPLANVIAALLAPLGDATTVALVAVSALFFGVLVYAAYLLGTRLFGRLVGLLFALVVFTRPALINSQAQALVDIPFVAFVLLAAALEADRPKRGAAVLVLLTLAGLLRPEGWLLTAAYVLYLLPGRRLAADRLRVLALGLFAPCAWAVFDLVVTGDPLYSFHGTQQLAAELDRPRSLGAALQTAPESLTSFLGLPLALAGLAGCLAAVVLLYKRALLPLALVGLGLLSFLALGILGLPVLNRYLIVPVIMLGLFASVTLLGWRRLDPGDWRRTPWITAAVLVGVALAVSVPAEIRRGRDLVSFLAQRRAIERDLHALSAIAARNRRGARAVHVTTRRAVPLLSAWLGLPPRAVSAVQPSRGARVLLVRHATSMVATNYYSLTTPAWSPISDPTVAWHELYRNKSWALYESAAIDRDAVLPGSGKDELVENP